MKEVKTNRADKMLSLLLEWEKSNETIINFCSIRGIACATFHYWKKKLREQGEHPSIKLKAPPPSAAEETKGKFIPIVPLPAALPSELHIKYPNGVSITCSSQLDSTQLQALIQLY